MPKSQPTVLPARFELNPDVFENDKSIVIKTLSFPHYQALESFRSAAENLLNQTNVPRSSTKKHYVTPDRRQLNNTLLACVPPLTHAFEDFGFYNKEAQVQPQRALAVGTMHTPLQTPTPQQMTELFQLWAGDWIARTQAINETMSVPIGEAGQRLRDVLSHPPQNWDWEDVPVGPLLNDIGKNDGLAFNALPALLASLLHDRTSIIVSPKGREICIRWRKAQGVTGNRAGLFVVSQPFHGQYVDEKGGLQEGYFAYRLNFCIETQAGRYSKTSNNLKPWVFIFLTCQRYAHEPLLKANYERNISFMVGIREARMKGYPYDSTFVRMTAKNHGTAEAPDYQWVSHLPNYISNFRADALPSPNDLMQNPMQYANFKGISSWDKDEYFLINAPGYKYAEGDDKPEEHAIQPGYSLRERADVLKAVLDLFGGALLPDTAFIQDKAAPIGAKVPAAMRTHFFFRKGSKRQNAVEIGRQAVEKGVAAATGASRINLSLLYREADTRDAMKHYIRDALFLAPSEDFPQWLQVTETFLDSDHLEVLPKPQKGNKKAIDLAWDNKHEKWYESLQASVVSIPNTPNLGLAEIGKLGQKGISPLQTIRGAVRSACARSYVSSQLAQTTQLRKTPKAGKSPYEDAAEHRMRNAVLDLLIRQTGTLMGSPVEIYKAAGVQPDIAEQLDVIAFVRRRCNRQYNRGDVQYALAVRLRATGAVEVMLANQSQWIPYAQAGHEVGRLFFSARRDAFISNGTRTNSQVKLNGAQLAQFTHRVLTRVGSQPTLAIIEANGWRNSGGMDTEGKVWPQLANPRMLRGHEMLDFSHLSHGKSYERTDKNLEGLLAVVRLRTGSEVPHYVPNRATWEAEDNIRELQHVSGFCDWTARPLLHYFSAGKTHETAKAQNSAATEQLYKLESSDKAIWGMYGDPHAARIPYRHPAMIEMVPFFVRPDFASDDGMTALCRIPHYLRFSPAWAMGNLDSPYPLHLGDALIEDQLCILGLGDD